MNIITSYQRPQQTPLVPSLPQQSKLLKLLYTIQKCTFFSASILTPERNQNGQILKQSQIISFTLLHDSKDIQYQYAFQVDVNLPAHSWKICATLLKHGRILNVVKEGLMQMLCTFVLNTNRSMNVYSLRVNPYTGVVKFSYVSHVSSQQMKQLFIYPVNFCELIKSHIQQMVSRLDQRLLGKILHMTNQISLKQILPSNIESKLKYETPEYLSQLCSTNPLFPTSTIGNKYLQNKKIKEVKRHISNSTIKYLFFSNPPQQYKIRFTPEIMQKRREQEKEQKVVRYNYKVLPFSTDVKKVLIQFTNNGEALQEEAIYGKVVDASSVEPTPKEIKDIYDILKVDLFQIGGKIYSPITIVAVEAEVPIGVGGFAQISRIPVQIALKQQSQNPQSGGSIGYKLIRQVLVRKSAARQKLFWQKQIIRHIGKGSCIFINKFYEPKISPQSGNLDRAFFQDSILMDFCTQRALNNYLSKLSPVISMKNKIFILYQISVGLRYLKDYSTVHLDMKPQNVLIRPATNLMTGFIFPLIKIIDFGEAYCDTLISRNKNRGHTCPYASPQLVRHSQSKYTQKSDIFSIGVMILIIIFQLNTVDIKRLTSSVLFQSNDKYIKFYSICAEKCRYFGYQPVMECLMRLAYKCISPIPTSRPYVNWVCVILRSLLDVIQNFQN